ncbi:MAG: glutamate racemase [Colwellia sp.]|uniref:glutamate racemase n=1 Tax=Colwellia sp. TaxID=56799 RepID=UPI0025BE36C7|nr:glutamate racemase [Colwellia sp.]NQZ26597.1 glutamate racemase [Colwellia sp.]
MQESKQKIKQKVTDNSAAIGVFDSGVGGLSITKCIAAQLPHENIIYIADSLHAPYGEKSVDFIIQRVNTIAKLLIAKGVKAIVIACNTATVNAIEQLRAQVNIPIIGVEPAIKPAAKQSISKKIAILATQATSGNQRFKDLIDLHHNGAQVLIQPCPGLVEFIEQGKQHSPACNALLRQYIEPLVNQGIDTLVLGCTHYPFVQHQISVIAGPQVSIIETAAPVTLQLSKKLAEMDLTANSSQQGQTQFFSSLVTKQQEQIFSQLWQEPLLLCALEHK